MRSNDVLSLVAFFLAVCAGITIQGNSRQFVAAADPKMSLGSHGASVFVDTTLLNLRDAKRAIVGRNLRVRGKLGDPDGNNGTIELTAKDGTINVAGIHYPEEFARMKEEGLQVTLEIEGSIRRQKVKNELTFYTSQIRRMSWVAKNDAGAVVEKGERKGIQ